MHALSARSIVHAWGSGRPLPTARRPLALLAEALPEADARRLAALSVGERDELLLHLRRSTFGRTLSCRAGCPSCAATLTFDLAVDEILDEGAARSGRHEEVIEDRDLRIRFRLPTAEDLAAAAALGDLERGRAALLERCVVEAADRGVRLAASELPASAVTAICRRMEELDPLAEVPVELDCPECGHHWSPLLDIASFLWQEIAAMAERLMYDVHVLARYYGWSEEEILTMGSARRKRYMDMASPSR